MYKLIPWTIFYFLDFLLNAEHNERVKSYTNTQAWKLKATILFLMMNSEWKCNEEYFLSKENNK